MNVSFALVAPTPEEGERLRSRLREIPEIPVVHDLPSLSGLLDSEDPGPEEGTNAKPDSAWIFVAPDTDARTRVGLQEESARRLGRWRILELLEFGGELRARPVSVGFDEPVDAVASRLAGSQDGEDEGEVLELHSVLQVVARARHDLNNPLTAAMAEIQLLLMDIDQESEAGQGLVSVQRQLERIRDMVAELRSLKPPRNEA